MQISSLKQKSSSISLRLPPCSVTRRQLWFQYTTSFPWWPLPAVGQAMLSGYYLPCGYYQVCVFTSFVIASETLVLCVVCLYRGEIKEFIKHLWCVRPSIHTKVNVAWLSPLRGFEGILTKSVRVWCPLLKILSKIEPSNLMPEPMLLIIVL